MKKSQNGLVSGTTILTERVRCIWTGSLTKELNLMTTHPNMGKDALHVIGSFQKWSQQEKPKCWKTQEVTK